MNLFSNRDALIVALAKTYHTNGYLEESEDLYSLSNNNKASAELLYLLADVRQQKMDFEGYYAALLELEKTGVSYPPALLSLGVRAIRQRRFAEAHFYLERALALEPQSRPIRDAQSRLLQMTGKAELDLVERGNDSLREKVPDPWLDRAYLFSFDLGQLLVKADASAQRGDLELAVEILDRAVAFGEDDWKAHVMRVNVFAKLGRVKDAVSSYQAAIRAGAHEGAALGELSSALLEQGQAMRLLELAEAALERVPDSADLQRLRSLAFREMGNLPRAEASLKRALQLMPESLEIARDLAVLLWERGKRSEAASYFTRLSRQSPLDVQSRTYLAQYYIENGQLEQAESFVTEALEIDSSNARLAELAKGYFIQYSYLEASAGDWVEVERLLELAKGLGPLTLDELKLQARAFRGMGKLEKAIALLRELAANYGDKPEVLMTLAELLEEQGRIEEAVEHYQAAVLRSGQFSAYAALRNAARARLAALSMSNE
ncbi:tetratricopeptide repeat protein [Pelagicoccus enzymogenes]|nr:tetratricopeptide repeat protein [Pelagicoccus enzymogenes]